jgi:hypothetical protein
MPKSKSEPVEKDFLAYAEKPPTPLQAHLADWLLEKTEYDPARAKSKADAFRRGVQLSAALRMEHQKSPENAERRELLKEEVAAARPVKAPKKAKKVVEPEPDEDDVDDEDEDDDEPAPKARKAPRPAKSAKKTRKAKPVTADDEEEIEAPF